MSAVVALPKGDKPCLITDTAAYHQTGMLIGFYSKVVTLPHMRAAIAVRGPAILPGLISGLINEKFNRFDDFIAEGAAYIEDRFADIEVLLGGSAEFRTFELTALGWSEEQDRARCFQLVNRVHPDNAGLIDPWQFFEFEDGLSAPAPPSPQSLVLAGMPEDIAGFDPDRDAIWFMNALRHTVMEVDRNGATENAVMIGGEVIITIITKDGVSQRVVHRWNDVPGRTIREEKLGTIEDAARKWIADDRQNAAANVVSFNGMNRKQRRAAKRGYH